MKLLSLLLAILLSAEFVFGENCCDQLRAEVQAANTLNSLYENCSRKLDTFEEQEIQLKNLTEKSQKLTENLTAANDSIYGCNEKSANLTMVIENNSATIQTLNDSLLKCQTTMKTDEKICNIATNTLERQVQEDATKKITYENKLSKCLVNLEEEQADKAELLLQIEYLTLQLDLYNATNVKIGVSDELLLRPKLFAYVLSKNQAVATLIFGPYALLVTVVIVLVTVYASKKLKYWKWKKSLPKVFKYHLNRRELPVPKTNNGPEPDAKKSSISTIDAATSTDLPALSRPAKTPPPLPPMTTEKDDFSTPMHSNFSTLRSGGEYDRVASDRLQRETHVAEVHEADLQTTPP